MNIDESTLKSIIAEVVRELSRSGGEEAPATGTTAVMTASKLGLRDVGEASRGTSSKEVVIGLTPAFGDQQVQTILGIPHSDVLSLDPPSFVREWLIRGLWWLAASESVGGRCCAAGVPGVSTFWFSRVVPCGGGLSGGGWDRWSVKTLDQVLQLWLPGPVAG